MGNFISSPHLRRMPASPRFSAVCRLLVLSSSVEFCMFGNKEMNAIVVKGPGATELVLRFHKSLSCLSLEMLGDRPRGLAAPLFAVGDARKSGYKTPLSALP